MQMHSGPRHCIAGQRQRPPLVCTKEPPCAIAHLAAMHQRRHWLVFLAAKGAVQHGELRSGGGAAAGHPRQPSIAELAGRLQPLFKPCQVDRLAAWVGKEQRQEGLGRE